VKIVKTILNIIYNISGLMPQCSYFEDWCTKTGWWRGRGCQTWAWCEPPFFRRLQINDKCL